MTVTTPAAITAPDRTTHEEIGRLVPQLGRRPEPPLVLPDGLLGSVANKIVQLGKLPVLIVH